MSKFIAVLPGQYYDAETGLHYNWHRYYDPATGRYINADPIGLKGGNNLYAYTGGNPVNYWDFNGLFVFGSRPLAGAPWIPLLSQCPTLDFLNAEVSHEHGFYEDGSGDNIGFGPDGPFQEDLGGQTPQEFGYRMDYKHYDDDLMRQAAQNVFDGEYSLLGCGPPEKNNCQDWAERLRDEYERLRRTTRPDLPRYTPIFTPMPISP